MTMFAKPPFVLGYAGLIPFVAATAAPWLGIITHAFAHTILLAYAAAILSFMAGIQWGLAMAHNQLTYARLGISVIPALIAWAALLLGGNIGLLLMAATFAGLLVYDLQLVAAGLAEDWYPKLRWPLTIIVVACLLATALT